MLVYWRVTKLDDIWMTGFASVQWKCEEVNLSLFFPENGGMIVVLENYERHFFWWIWFEREGYLHYKSNCIYIYICMFVFIYIYIYTGVSMYTQVYLYMWKCIHVPIPSFQSFFFTHHPKSSQLHHQHKLHHQTFQAPQHHGNLRVPPSMPPPPENRALIRPY